jgi:hypothetical protein
MRTYADVIPVGKRPEGKPPMFRLTLSYARYAITCLATVTFGAVLQN